MDVVVEGGGGGDWVAGKTRCSTRGHRRGSEVDW